MKRRIANFVCRLLGVQICPPLIETIKIINCNIQGDVDLSKTTIGKNLSIDVSNNPQMTGIVFPRNQISEGTKIYLNGKRLK